MNGYQLIALSPKGEEAIKHRKLSKKDKRAEVNLLSQNPYTISVRFTDKILKYVAKEDVLKLMLMRELPFCQEGRDYSVKIF